MAEQERELLPAPIVDLVDELLEQLQLQSSAGRIELEFRDRRLTKLRRHEEFSRSELGELSARTL